MRDTYFQEGIDLVNSRHSSVSNDTCITEVANDDAAIGNTWYENVEGVILVVVVIVSFAQIFSAML